MDQNLHPLLLRQIKKSFTDSSTISPELNSLLKRVSDSYAEYDKDHTLVERSLDLSSKELTEINKNIEEKIKQRTEELRQEHTRFIASINSLDIGFVMIDARNNIAMSNPVAAKILSQPNNILPDMTPGALSLQSIHNMLSPTISLKDTINTCLESGKSALYDNVNFNNRWLRIFLAPIISTQTEGGNLGTVLIVEDITDEKIIERSKNEFFSIASHELRTPLTAIRGNTEMIKKYYPAVLGDPNLNEMINDIHESAVRLIGIVNDFLDLSALEQGKVPMKSEIVNLKDITAAVTFELSELCRSKGISLVTDPSIESIPAVIADNERVKQVIINLVGNALKFTDKGTITLATSKDDSFVKYSIIDTGRGISSENQQLLFRKFQQASSSLITRDTTKGTGLGLYISKLIVERCGGKISLDSSVPEQGSTFSFTLPLYKQA